MKKICFLLSLIVFFTVQGEIQSQFKPIYGRNTIHKQNLLLNINTATKDEMLKNGISKSYVNKIIEYRDITGGFFKLNEMLRIRGIGRKTFLKLKLKFKKPQNVQLNRFNINTASNKILKYYGFNKKQIKKIRRFKMNNRFKNNLELKKIISKNRYDALIDYIDY